MSTSARTANTIFWPHTRIRRRGMAGYRNLQMRSLFKGTAIYLTFFFVFALGYVWTRVQVMEMGYRIRQFQGVHDRLKEENREMAVEAATLRSPQRLETMATQLGLKRPGQNQIYFLK